MNAAVLAAGLGTRLRPLTFSLPKALLPVLNRPLLGIWLARLAAAGFTRVAVNTHHLSGQVHAFLDQAKPQGLEVIIRHEPEILGTGGGLRRLGAALGFEAPFLAVNSDILTDLDPAGLYRQHQPRALATLAVHDCAPHNHVWVAQGKVLSIGAPPVDGAGVPLAYAGLQVVGREICRYLPDGVPYDLVAAWREALAAGELLAARVVSGHFWQDLGTPAAYLEAHRRLLAGAAPGLAPLFPPLTDPFLGPETVIGSGVVFGGGVCLGAGVEVGAGAYLQNTVAWERARIAPGVRLLDCLVGAAARVTDSARGQVLV
jgi:mannose-1-phosphate guanylyltransferase